MGGATQEARTAVMILVEATWLDLSGAAQSITARMENRSAHGACIRMKAPIAVAKRIYIQSHRDQFSGIVKYCRVDGKEFLVGIHKDAVNRPMPKKPAAPNVLTPQTARQASQEMVRTIDVAAKRSEEAGFPAAPGQVKANATFKNEAAQQQESAVSAARDAAWMAERKPERNRDDVPPRVNESRENTSTKVAREFITRIEEPIAARLLVQDSRSRESLPSAPQTRQPVAENVAQRVATGNGSEEKKRRRGGGL